MGSESRYFELNTGATIPAIGFGTYAGSGDIVAPAILIGDVFKKMFEDGVVKREELFITSKLWNYDHEPEDVAKAFDKTLSNLQLDYLDLYLFHWPVKVKKGTTGSNPEDLLQPDLHGTWKAMEAVYDSGKARAIGVSNFSIEKLGYILEVARVPPAVNQIECHPLWHQDKLRAFCKSKGVHVSVSKPVHDKRIHRWVHKCQKQRKNQGCLDIQWLTWVAAKAGKSPAQVALRWGIHSVLPKTASESRLQENLDIFDWSIPEDLLSHFSEIEQENFVIGAIFVHEKSSAYKTVEELWDEM